MGSEIYDGVAKIRGISQKSSVKIKDTLKDNIYSLKNLDISDEDRAFIIDEIFRLNGDEINDAQRDAILDVLDLDNFTEDENKKVKKYSKIATILEISPDATVEEKKSLFNKLTSLNKPYVETSEKAIIVDEILKLKDNINKEKEEAILNLLDLKDSKEKDLIENYSKIATILGLPTTASKEEKNKLISKLEMLQDPNIGAVQKTLIIDEILELKKNIENSEKDAIIDVLESNTLTDKEKKVVKNFSNIDKLFGESPTVEEKKRLASKLEMLLDPFIDVSEKALILDEI